LDQEEQFASIKKTQIAYNYEEQGKISTYLLKEKGVQDGDPSHPPSTPSGEFGAGSREFLATF
jgi:hypothetical protein